jgi:hypothetical protein
MSQAAHDAFGVMVGPERGFRLMRLWENTTEGSAYDRMFSRRHLPRRARFIMAAQADGYTQEQIDAFLDLK